MFLFSEVTGSEHPPPFPHSLHTHSFIINWYRRLLLRESSGRTEKMSANEWHYACKQLYGSVALTGTHDVFITR